MTTLHTPQTRCLFAIERCDITPPLGIYHRMWGAASHERAEAVHRPLTATIVCFADSSVTSIGEATPSQYQVIISLDHCVMGPEEIRNMRDAIGAASPFARESLLVVCTHTHASGLMMLNRGDQPGGEMIEPYLREVNEKIAALASRLASTLQPSTIVYGTAHCKLAANRDYWDERAGHFVCGLNPSGTGDETVLVAKVVDQAESCLATVVNYGCHPTTLAWDNRAISPDYIGGMREVVESATNDAPCLFLQGASGDLGPVEGFVGDPAIADRNGAQLGHAALSTLVALPEAGTKLTYQGPVVSGATIGAWRREKLAEGEYKSKQEWQLQRLTIPLPYREELPSCDEVEQELAQLTQREEEARAAGDETHAADLRALAERQRRMKARVGMLPPGETFPLQVIVGRWGDAYWVAVQGEPYSIFQQHLRQAFADTPVIIMSLANEWGASYIPPADRYETSLYQVEVAVLAPGSLERLSEKVAQALENLSA